MRNIGLYIRDYVMAPLFYGAVLLGHAHAAIPQPGKDLIPGGNKDFIDIFLAWLKKGGPLVVGVIGVAVCAGSIAVLYKAFQKAQEMGDMGIFWRHLLPTGLLITMGMILLFLATQYYA